MRHLLLTAAIAAACIAAPASAAHKPHKHAPHVQAPPPPVFVIPDAIDNPPYGERPAGLPPDAVYVPARAVGLTHYRCNSTPEVRALTAPGEVQISYDVAADGTIGNVTVVKPSGFPVLDAFAVSCAATVWKNTPASINGKPVATRHILANHMFRPAD